MEKNEYLDWIKHTRDDWIDEIPSEMVDSLSRPNNYKVRRVWFQSLYDRVALGISEGLVDERGRIALQGLRDHIQETDLSHRLTTSEDIKKANEVLNLIVDSLENS
jgi:hypothetical protein